MKKLSTLFVVALCALLPTLAKAQNVSAEKAELVCKRFVSEKRPDAAKNAAIKFEEAYQDERGGAYLYRFSVNDHGFVIVSGTENVMPILAYSFEDEFKMNPAIRDLFYLYKQVGGATAKGEAPVEAKTVSDWYHYTAETFIPRTYKNNGEVGPLVTTRWNQNKYHNTYCPWDANAGSYYDYRVPNGCVALAVGQILNYHRWPEHAIGGSSYIPPGYPRQTVNFSQHRYNYDAMCNEPQSYANEISKLVYHFGVAIQMGYTADGSGAQTDDAKEQLNQKFLYDWTISKYYRGNFLDTTVAQYIALLKGEIDAHRPVYYAGCTQSYNSCHAYVLDGYDEDDHFHLNYGWGGYGNGYYAIDNFVSGNSHYDYGGEAIVNIFPSGAYPATYCQGHQRNTATFGYVADGSPTAKPYQANPDCSWMVAAPHAYNYRFTVDRLDLLEDVDYVTIYNGPTEESGVKVTLTGSEVPSTTYTVSADSVLIRFHSNGSAQNTDHYGFLFSYDTDIDAQTCSTTTNMSDWTSTITDGSSAGSDYVPESNCTWNVNLNYISGYAFGFRKFDLGYGDFVDVYNYGTTPPTLLYRFDIYNQPTEPVYTNYKKLRFNFVSDNWDQGDGFELEYWAIAGVEDHTGIEELNIYPNPATNVVNVDFTMNEPGVVSCKLMDAMGRVLALDTFDGQSENHHTMDVSSLAAGMYMIEINTPTGKTIQKVMVQ